MVHEKIGHTIKSATTTLRCCA